MLASISRYWWPYLYQYGVGVIIFAIGLIVIIKCRSCILSRAQDRRWFAVLIGGFVWYAGMHLLWYFIAIPRLSDAEIDSLVTPIAGYPDPLIDRILPASRHPLDIVRASRTLEDTENETAQQAAKPKRLEPSVAALLDHPELLQQLSANLDWTIALGTAVSAEPDRVRDAIERYRTDTGVAATTEGGTGGSMGIDHAAGHQAPAIREQPR